MQTYVVFLFLLLSTSLHAFIPKEELKNLNLTTDDDLNPLNGIPWAEGILENYGELAEYEDPVRQLVLLLFHRTGTFDPSTRNHFAKDATPREIGELMGQMKSGQFKEKGSKGDIGSALKALKVNNIYNPLAYRVLSTLLYYKAPSREDYKYFYEGLQETYPKGIDIPKDWRAWLEEKFTAEVGRAPNPPDIDKDYDAYLFWVLSRRSEAPPLQLQGTSKSKAGAFADCGETSLRNFLKLILDHNGEYNVKVLEELGADSELLAFFTEFKTRADQENVAARDAWSNLTVGHPEVRYVKDKYELNAGADNMLTLLKRLLPKLNDAKDWESTFRFIEEARKKSGLGDFNLTEVKLANHLGDLIFSVANLGRFVWHFQSGHFYIAPLPAETLGEYPFAEREDKRSKDAAIFYPMSATQEGDRFLYTTLRNNENIEKLIEEAKRRRGEEDLPLSAAVGLLNRLSTEDARRRIFPTVVDTFTLKRLLEDKHLTLYKEHLFGLIKTGRFGPAQILGANSRFIEKFGFYLPGHGPTICALALSPDGGTLYSTSCDNTIRIWDLKTGQATKVLSGHGDGIYVPVLSPDGGTLYSGSSDNTIHIWDLKTGQATKVLSDHWDAVIALALSPDGGTLYSGSGDKTIRIWDLKTGQEPKVLAGHRESVNALALSPHGSTLYSGSIDGSIRIWDLKSGQAPKVLSSHWSAVYALALSPDGSTLYSGSRDKAIHIWDLKTRQATKVLSGHGGDVFALALSPDGGTLYSGSDDRTIRIWDLKTGQELKVLSGHGAAVKELALSPDGGTLYSGSYDNTIRIWDLKKELRSH